MVINQMKYMCMQQKMQEDLFRIMNTFNKHDKDILLTFGIDPIS